MDNKECMFCKKEIGDCEDHFISNITDGNYCDHDCCINDFEAKDIVSVKQKVDTDGSDYWEYGYRGKKYKLHAINEASEFENDETDKLVNEIGEEVTY